MARAADLAVQARKGSKRASLDLCRAVEPDSITDLIALVYPPNANRRLPPSRFEILAAAYDEYQAERKMELAAPAPN